MNKATKMVLGVIIGIFVIGGGAIAYRNNQDTNKQAKMAMEEKTKADAMANDQAMMKAEESSAMQAKDDTAPTDDKAMDDAQAMSKHGAYVALADYTADPAKYADSKKVYFFHASWCPICKSIDEAINSDASVIPTGVTIIKTDFDSSTDLRKKYGVTTQYTFVQVDQAGEETAQWSATTVQKAIDGIEI